MSTPQTSGPPLGTPPPVTRPKRRRRILTTVLLASVLLIVVSIVATVLAGGPAGLRATAPQLTEPTAASAVRDFFDALAAGDADRAHALILDSDQSRRSDHPLLSDRALTDAERRPKDVSVGDAKEFVDPETNDLASVDVTYRAGNVTISRTYLVHKKNGAFLIEDPFVTLTVNGAHGRTVSVNGVAMKPVVVPEEQEIATDIEVRAFPGSYRIVGEANALFAETSADAVPEQATVYGKSVASASLPPPELATGAEDTIRKTVRALIDKCVASTAEHPEGCPFGTWVTDPKAPVNWSLIKYPTISLEIIGGYFARPYVDISDDGTGMVRYSSLQPWTLDTRKEVTEDKAFRISARAELSDGSIVVTL